MRLNAFLRLFENDCSMCMRRDRCNECRSRVAKNLLMEFRAQDAGPKLPEIDNSISARCARVMMQLRKEKRPIQSRQIILEQCPPYLKEFTLNHMVNHRMIRRKRTAKWFYEYFIPEKGHNRKGYNK